MTNRSILLFFVVLGGCSSKPILMNTGDVKVSRDEVPSRCHEIGRVSGQSTSVHGSTEEALEDLKKDAARKGANFVKMGQVSDLGTAVTGVAYDCP